MASLDDLYLHEQLLLLALHDDKGTMQGASFEVGAAGAVLAELLLGCHIGVEQVKKKRMVKVRDASLPGDPLLDEVLQRIRTAKRSEQVTTWVARIAGTKRMRHRIAERLRMRGILGKREGRVLLVFSRDLYPTTDPAPERELVERIRRAVLADGEVPARTAIMLTLAQQLSMLGPVLTRAELKQRKQRLKQLASLETVEEGARAAIKGVRDVMEAQAAHVAIIAAG
jgi:hypothetical protein